MAKRKYDQAIYETRIRPLLDAKPGTNRDKEKAMGLPDKIISNWNNLHLGSWAYYLNELSAFLGVSVEYLLCKTDDPTPHPVVGSNYFIPPEIVDDTVHMPILGEIAAGYDHIAFESWTGDTIEIPRSYLRGHEPQDYFVLRVIGNSMYPDYRDGDHVLVLRQETLDYSGQIGVVLYDGSAYKDSGTLKKIEYVPNEWMRLSPLNLNEYSPIKFVGEDMIKCRIQGVVKMLIRNID